jgi:ribosomal protein S18 acetylase RimI-like enzyme
MLIRRLNLKNVVALQGLRAAANADGTLGCPAERKLALTLEYIEQQLQSPFETFGAFVDEMLVGAASLSRMPEDVSDPDDSDWYALSFVVVHPNARSQGVGRALVQECLSRAMQLCAAGVLLELNVPNTAAKSLYESLGFETWNVFEAAYQYDGQQFDQVSMKKKLREV